MVISILIWQASEPFADAAQWVGLTLKLPGSVRGATLDAIASSMPEFFTGVFFVILALVGVEEAAAAQAGSEGLGATLATIAGSAVYNMVLIPAFCAIFISIYRKDDPAIKVQNEVVSRDGVWFLVIQGILVVFLCMDYLYWWMALVLIGLYGIYIWRLFAHARRYRHDYDPAAHGELIKEAKVLFGHYKIPLNKLSVPIILLLSTLIAASSCYWLVEVTMETAAQLQIPLFFVAVILAAAASSVPDTFLSIGAAKRGDDDGAISNAFGSNIYDICICFPIPLLVSAAITGWQPIPLTREGEAMEGLAGLRVMLSFLTIATLIIMWHRKELTRKKAYILCFLYLLFIAYAIAGSLKIEIF